MLTARSGSPTSGPLASSQRPIQPVGTGSAGDAVCQIAVVAFGDHRGVAGGADDPPGERPGTAAHVFLGVAVAVAEGEQFHEFAGEVFVGGLCRVGLPVEPTQHRGVGQHGVGEGAEIAQRKRPQFLVLCGHVSGDPDLLRGGGEVVVPQQCQLFVDRLSDGDHAAQPPVRQQILLLGQLLVVLLAGRLGRASGAFAGWARLVEGGHWGGDRARVGIGDGAQHGVDVRCPVPAERRVDLGPGYAKPGAPQRAGRSHPLRRLPSHALTVGPRS
jgi:hypothetical protein